MITILIAVLLPPLHCILVVVISDIEAFLFHPQSANNLNNLLDPLCAMLIYIYNTGFHLGNTLFKAFMLTILMFISLY